MALKLDELDRRILYELDQNSRMPFKELGRRLRMAPETARFRVLRMVKARLIKNFITTMGISQLNRFYYKFFYKFHKTHPAVDRQIVQFIQTHPKVAYFASLEGRYDVTFLLLSQDFGDLYDFLIPFRERFGDYVLEQEILTMPAVHRFNLRFFYPKGTLKHTQYPLKLSQTDMDALDFHIVRELAKDARIDLVQLGRRVGAEASVVKYRLQRLRKAGVIGTAVLDIDYEAFGVQHFQVDFSLRNHSAVDRIIAQAAQHPKCTFATVTLGKYDLALEFAVEDMKELRTILNDLKSRFVKDIVDQDVFILQEHKINWYPQSETAIGTNPQSIRTD